MSSLQVQPYVDLVGQHNLATDGACDLLSVRMLVQLLCGGAQLAYRLVGGELIEGHETVEAAPTTGELLQPVVELVQVFFVLTPCVKVDILGTKWTFAVFVKRTLFDEMLSEGPLIGLL